MARRCGTLATMISCTSIAKTYGGNRVLKDVSLAVQPGEWVTVTGKSASGKSTLVKLLLAAEQPDAGRIEVDGVALADLPPDVLQLYRSRVGIVFQEPMMLPHMTIEENITFPLIARGMDEQRAMQIAGGLLKRLGIAERAEEDPMEVPAAHRMLAGIARALAGNPMIVIADEPFAPLDPAQHEAVLSLLKEAHDAGITVVLFTTDAGTALPGRIVTLAGGSIAAPQMKQQPTTFERAQPHRILDPSPSAEADSAEAEEDPSASEASPDEEDIAVEAQSEETEIEEERSPVAEKPKEELPPQPKKKGPRSKRDEGDDQGRKIRITPIHS